MKNFFLCVIIFSCIAACTSTSKPETNIDELSNAQIKVPGITPERLSAGKKFYVMGCSGCHALKNPARYTAGEWEPILQKMFIKSKITDDKEKILIRDYLIAKSK